MKKPLQISIPTPCHENWANMTPADRGRFCASCQKNVHDFTRSSDREIAEAIKNGGSACGRFRASQLERDLVIPKGKSKLWVAASAAAITLLTIGNNTVSAQTPVKTEQHESKTDDIKDTILPDGLKKITGTVIDQFGLPIPGATVKVLGKTDAGVQTDFDGNFSIEAQQGKTLEFNYLGMKTRNIVVRDAKLPIITMEDDTTVLESIIVGCYSSGEGSHIGVASQYMFGY